MLRRRLGFHPRAFLQALMTYPRFLGRIKPELLVGSEAEILARIRALDHRWKASKLEVPIGRRILILSAHPDDEAIGAGGLLLAHRGQAEIHIAAVFTGEGGGRLPEAGWTDTVEYRERLARARRRELEEVGAELGAMSIQSLDLPDGGTFPTAEDVARVARLVERVRPDVVLLPWFLDNQRDHKVANVLYASACAGIEAMVLSFEIWTLCQPNAYFDTTDWVDRKADLIGRYATQTGTVDYTAYARGLGTTRGFLHGVRRPSGAAEAFFALPNRDYCELVRSLYGSVGALTPVGRLLASR